MANIKQIKIGSSTYDIKDGVSSKMLWTNPSYTSSFANQTITVSGLSDYNYITVGFSYSTVYPDYSASISVYLNPKRSTWGGIGNLLWYGSGYYGAQREFTIDKTNNKVTFNVGTYLDYQTRTVDNRYAIPQWIVGQTL